LAAISHKSSDKNPLLIYATAVPEWTDFDKMLNCNNLKCAGMGKWLYFPGKKGEKIRKVWGGSYSDSDYVPRIEYLKGEPAAPVYFPC